MLLLLWPLSARAEAPVDFAAQIKPILKARCFSCHGALKQEAALRLDTGELLRNGGDSGATVLAGKPGASLLLERISDPDEASRMPPEGKPLTPEEIDLFRRWIIEGARSPVDEEPEPDPREHWAFQKPQRNVPVSSEQNPWVRNPIDAFIAARHAELGIEPLSAAKKHLLLRRVYLDLIGLPPTRDELHAFLQDDSPHAYEAVVDRLLSSKHYGERWGRHWMDVWRYSDWYGRRNVNDVRNSYPHIWRWRDWIIESLNEDKGYDQMIREMLAADELYPDDDTRMPALGFIVRNWFSLNYDTWKQDLVEHTGKAFLGLRLNCAHCHDHKYDPISQEEYFQFRAFFEPLELRHDRVPGGPALTRYIRYRPGSGGSLRPIEAGLPRVYDHYHDEKTFMYRLGDTRDRLDRDPVAPAAPTILGGDSLQIESVTLPPVAWYPGLKGFVAKEERQAAEEAIATAERNLAAARMALAGTRQALADAEAILEAATKTADKAVSAEGVERDAADVMAHWRFEGTNSFLDDSSGHGQTLRRVTGSDSPVSQVDLKPSGTTRRFDLAAGPENQHAAEFQQPEDVGYLTAAGDASFFANEFSFECLLHSDVSQRNFNRTIVDYPGSWMLLHRGLSEKQFELRVRYTNEAGDVRDVRSSRQPHPEFPAVETDSPPLILQAGRDYYVCLVMGLSDVSLHVADLSAKTALQSFVFSRSGATDDGGDGDFTRLRRPVAATPLNLGNSDGTGRFDGLLDEIRLTRHALSIEQIAAAVGQPATEAMRMAAAAVADLKKRVESQTVTATAAEATLEAAEKRLSSVNARLAADHARFVDQRSDKEAVPLIQAAVAAEYHARLAASRSGLAAAELTLVTQRHSAKPDSGAIKKAEATIKSETSTIAKLTESGVPSEGEYTSFAPKYPKTSTGRRSALAQWLASPENPLTARVAINHIWMRHFGKPLVESVFDFGRGGKRPSHPGLLDWLAVELMQPSSRAGANNAGRKASPWRMKRIHRLIVTSNTYRLSSRAGADHPSEKLDPDNAAYWKSQQRRLEAETIRDSLLSVSGQLDPAIGGQDLDPGLEATSRRRSLYFSVYPEGGGMMRFLTLFDAPDPCDCYRRAESLVPQQALGMSNSVMALNLGRLLTKGLGERLSEATDEEFVTAAYETILSRQPSSDELSSCIDFLTKQRRLFDSTTLQPAAAKAPLVAASTDRDQRVREGLVRVLLNHHEFVTAH
ncbi:MAG: PSD1 and planctomycete cytochrome C domain-containing protein [Planctomycetota bacterium]